MPLSIALSGTSIMRGIKYILTTGIAVISMFFGTLTLAEDTKFNLPTLSDEKSYYWSDVDNQMSQKEYKTASKHNQRVATKLARSYLEEKIISLGIPVKGVAMAGAAVNFAFTGGKFNLNKSKTLQLEFDDPIDSGRAMFLKYKLEW